MNKVSRFCKNNQSLFVLLLICLLMSFASDRFLTWGNFVTVLRQTSINALLATGISFAILTGGIDLSIGSVLAISGAFAASLVREGLPLVLLLPLILLLGVLLGFVNGLLISKGGLQPFIATLGMMALLRGLTMVYTQGKPISCKGAPASAGFGFIGTGFLLGIPTPVYIMAAVFALAHYILRKRRIGRYIYALGSNEEATLFSGINTGRVKLFVYAFSGLLAALAGIMVTARLGSASPQAGLGYEMDAIAAAVLGGTRMSGGVGTVLGTIIGCLIIGVLNNALNLLNIDSNYQDVVKGAVILLAVLIDRKNSSKRA